MASTSLVFDLLARDHASGTFNRVGNSSLNAGGKLSKLGGHLKTVAKYGALAAAAGAVLAAKWGVDAVKAAAADQQAQKLLEGALKRNAKATNDQVASTEDWISAQGRAKGVADDDLRPALARLVTATKDVGDAQKLASLAMDVSAGTGKSLESVSTALMKAQNGQVSGLSRLGVKTKNVAGETMSLKEITKDLADTYGGAASEKANTFQGKMDRLKLVYNETKEAIGAKLLPILSDLGTWFLDKGIPAISAMWGWLKNKLGPVFAEVGDFVRDRLLPALSQFSDDTGPGVREAMDAIKGAFRDAKPFLQDMGNFITATLIPALGILARDVLPLVARQIRMAGKAFAVIGGIFKFTWNNLIQPQMKMFAMAIANMLDLWGTMLGALSHVPGFEWAKGAADKLHHAADEARGFADALKKIPPRVSTTITTTYVSRGGPGGQAGGSGSITGGGGMGGAGKSAGRSSSNRSMFDGAEIRIVGLQDPAAKAFIHTGGTSRY